MKTVLVAAALAIVGAVIVEAAGQNNSSLQRIEGGAARA